MRPRATTLIPIAVLVAAFAARLVMLIQTRNLPIYYQPLLDSGFFHQWADFKHTLVWADGAPTFREPVYAYFVALIYTVFRESLTIVRLVQCIIGSATVLMLYASAKKLYGTLAATIAAVILALFSPAIFFSSEINETTLAVFLVVASAYVLTRARSGQAYLNSGLSGLLAGAAFLTRFTTVVALPAWILHLLLSREPRLRKATLMLLVGFAIAPLCYHGLLLKADQRAYLPLRTSWHAFLGSGATGGIAPEPAFEIGVGGSRGAYTAMATTGRIDGHRDFLRYARIEDPDIESQIDAHRHWGDRVAEDLASNPARYLRTYFSKLGVFWGPTNPPSNLDMRYVAEFSPLLMNRALSFAVIAGLGLLGLVAGTRRTSLGFMLYVLCFPLVASVYLVSDIEKMLVVPFLAMFAGFAGAAIIEGIRSRRVGRTIGYLIAAAVLIAIIHQLPGRELNRARNLVVAGDAYAQIGVFEKAEGLYQEAVALSPGLADARISLVKIYAGGGKAQMALEVLDQAILKSEDPRLRIEKAELMLMGGRPEEALVEVKNLQESYPYEPRLHQLMGRSLLATGAVDQAIVELEREIEYVGSSFVTLSVLGEAALKSGDYDKAARNLEEAITLNPQYSSHAASQLADAYSRTGQYLRACGILGRILSVDSGNMPMKFKLGVCLYKADRLADALMHFRELHKFDPGSSDIMLNMGTVYAAMDSIDRAVEMWEQALVIDPENETARDNLRTARE